MTSWIPPRLRPVIGADLDSVSADSIANLIGLAEDTDLEFKAEPWAATTGGSKECALDIADKANASGALIVVGIEEHGDGRATAITPIPAGGTDLGLRVHQIVAERVSPTPLLTHRQIAVDGGSVHLFTIAPSTRPPHGVAVGDYAFRFPIRSGTTRTWLSEPELANRYQRRFLAAADQRERADAAHQEALDLVPGDRTGGPWSWLVVSAVPEFPGRLALRRGLSDDWGLRIGETLNDFPGFRRGGPVHVTTGFRCLRFTDDLNRSVTNYHATGGQLGLTGDSAIILGHRGGKDSFGQVDDTSMVFDEHIVADLINTVGLAAQYAAATGAVGYLSVSAELVSSVPMLLGEYRSGFNDTLSGTRQVQSTSGRSDHLSSLDDLATPGLDRVAMARLLALDLFSAFGLPEVQQITMNGEFALDRFNKDHLRRVTEWASAADVPTVDRLLPPV